MVKHSNSEYTYTDDGKCPLYGVQFIHRQIGHSCARYSCALIASCGCETLETEYCIRDVTSIDVTSIRDKYQERRV